MDSVNQLHRLRRPLGTASALRYPAIILCCIMGLFYQAIAADEQSLEYQVKAAFLLNFTKFTEWPSSAFSDAKSPFTICVMGVDPFGSALDQIVRGETTGGHKMAVQRIKRGSRPQTCQVLFIGRTEKEAGSVLADLGSGVLTVGEGDSFLQAGGMISFVIENRRTRFDINSTAAENAGLKLSSRLLSVARTVKP
jgi:hypothetical protein